MFRGLNFVIVHVPDVAQVKSFYVDTLGFAIDGETDSFLQFRQPESGATYAVGRDEPGHDRIELWWYVDDADATHRDLLAKGVTVVTPPTDAPFGRFLSIKDPAGNEVFLLQPATR
jgi:predicted enzyme related to lactoylglutathione lyase